MTSRDIQQAGFELGNPTQTPYGLPVEPAKVLSITVAVLNIMVAEPCSRDWEWIYI
jgi:hypothetical protein